MTDVFPTHTCFDDVSEILLELAKKGHKDILKKSLIVHAVCRLPSGQPYSHAWLEVDAACWFCGIVDGEKVILTASPREEFYEYYKVQELKKYTLSEVRKFGNVPPPWEEPFKSLCNDGDKRVERPE